MAVTIREATRDDAREVGRLVREFQAYLRALGDETEFAFDAEAYLRDGFGSNPAFSGMVADLDGQVVGYLLYHFGYDTDRAVRLLYVIDLYVDEPARRRGVATALMQAAAAVCTQAGGAALTWTVFKANKLAMDFYERLGARRLNDLVLMWIPPARLRRD